jgi:hypothetical protein
LNILDKILGRSDDEAVNDGPRGRKSLGPQRVRFQTGGQVRRARLRSIEANRRKVAKRSRRSFKDNMLSVAILRGQLQAVGKVSYVGIKVLRSGDAASAEKILTERYGSVDKALEVYTKIQAERARRGAAQVA